MQDAAGRPLKIALVAPYDLSVPGGVNAHIRSLASALRVLGHEVLVYGPASDSSRLGPGEEAVGGAIALNIGGTVSGLGLNPLLQRRVNSILRSERFDVVHIHEPLAPMVPLLFLRSARCATVGTFHVHRESGHAIYAASSWLLKRWVKLLDCRIAVSEAARQTAARYFPGPYEMIPNGVDFERFNAPAPRPRALCSGHRHLLFVGRLEGRKGLPYLLQAMPPLVRRFPDVHLVVVGEGPERAEDERFAAMLAPGAVSFVGPVVDAELPGYFQGADVFVSPATGGESFGIVLLEAMAAGKPIVASAIEGYAGLLVKDEAGLLVPPRDPEALAAALTRVLDDDKLRDQLGNSAETAARKYDWLALARRIETLYRRIQLERARQRL